MTGSPSQSRFLVTAYVIRGALEESPSRIGEERDHGGTAPALRVWSCAAMVLLRAATPVATPERRRGSARSANPLWALLVSNQRPPPCEDGALPLS